MLEFEQIVKIAYWVILGIILFILVGRFFYFQKNSHKRIANYKEKSIYKFFRYATILVIPLFLFGCISFVFVFQKGNMFAPNWMKNLLLISLVLILVTEIFYNYKVLPKQSNRILNILFFTFASLIGGYLLNLYRGATVHPTIEESVIIEFPFKGQWIAAGAGASGLTNHHDRIMSQKYAVDIVRIGSNGKLFTGKGIEHNESNTYGAEILSPVNGKVVYLVDTLPNHPIRERDKLAGNHLVIQFQDSLYVALAHLQKKSIPVNIGDFVSAGDFVGLVGMSGNTDFCHLHIHIQDRPIYDIENGKAFPIRFKEFRRKRIAFWRTVENEYLLSNDIIETK